MKRNYKPLLPAILSLLIVWGLMYFLNIGAASATVAPNPTDVIQAGLSYLQSQQQADGGIVGFSGTSDPDTTARTVVAFVSAGKPVTTVVSSQGKSMLDYLSAQTITYTHDATGTLFPGRAGILLTAVSITGGKPSSFGGMNLAGELEKSFHADSGAYSTTAKQAYSSGEASDVSQAWAILGLSLAGQPVPEQATNYLVQSQATDGSWGGGDPDTTALVVTAMLASGNVTNQNVAIQKGLNYFHSTQLPSAGWRPSWDTDPLNADSTGWILQALITAGEDPRGQSWIKNQTNPLDALLSLQKPDGSIGGTNANTYSTAEAIIGLSGNPLSKFRIAPVIHRAGLAIFYGDNSLFTKCISFSESSITGLDLLKRSDLALQTATDPNRGTAVCKIGEVGDSSANCFGSMPNYWSYWQLGANGWEYSVTGADQSKVMDGSVNAWSWGTGDPPIVVTFQNICEGVVMPTIPIASSSSTATASASPVPSISPATLAPKATSTVAAGVENGTGSYIAYAAILIVLGVLIIFIIRSRRR